MCVSTFMNNYCIYSLLTGNQFLSIQMFQFCYIESIIFFNDNNSNSYSCNRTLMEVFRHMNFHGPTIGWRYSLNFVYFVDFSSNSHEMYYYLGPYKINSKPPQAWDAHFFHTSLSLDDFFCMFSWSNLLIDKRFYVQWWK